MLHRTLAIGSAAALALTAALLPTVANAKAQDCQVDITLDNVIVIDAVKTPVTATLNSSPNGCFDNVAYSAEFNGQSFGTFVFNGNDEETFIAEYGPGKYSASFVDGVDQNGNKVFGNDTQRVSVAKYKTTTAIAGARTSSKKVGVQVHVEAYNPDLAAFSDAYRTIVKVQAKDSIGDWKTVATIRTDNQGNASTVVNAKTKSKLKWRAVASTDSSRWTSTSSSIKR